MKILTILGARPQFIKAATLSRTVRAHNDSHPSDQVQEVIVHTGQHFDANMSDVFFDQLDIPRPAHQLRIANLDHGAMTGRMLEGIEHLVKQERPDCLLVYGDTNSTLAGALAAAKLHLRVAHVEAGLRSHNLAMPEEINRVLTDRVSSQLFCPTQAALDNLASEGFPFRLPGKRMQQIVNAGDVMYDATLRSSGMARRDISLETWALSDGAYVLCTLHRAENTDDEARLSGILGALREIAREVQVVLPLHPRTHHKLLAMGKRHWLDGILVIDPVPYLEMQRLEIGARVILTDSGGMQKEAYFHQVPCVTLRDETEWVETAALGWNQVVGADPDRIVAAWRQARRPEGELAMPYGDGKAAARILAAMLAYA